MLFSMIAVLKRAAADALLRNMGISVVVMSNPRNPTGQVIKGSELEQLVELGRKGTTLV